ncbi:MAG: hypothetical protein PVG42_04215, partial [Lysobacterales bacterium]
SSPAERAKQTVLAVCGEFGFDAAKIRWDRRIYGAWARTLFEVLREIPGEFRRVLIAGHNPGLEDLLQSLAGGDIETPPDGKLMPTAAVARLEIEAGWSELAPAVGRLLSLTRARSLEF